MDAVLRNFLKREFPVNNALLRRLFAPVDNASLAYFRVVFGIIMLWEIGLRIGIVQDFYIAPSFHFTYYGFDWVRPWPGVGMYAHLAVLGVLAAFIMVGFLYRISAALFFVGITYVFLLDKALYLNHLYLICLVSFLMIFVPAHRTFSIDSWRNPAIRSQIAPSWALWTIRAQVGFVYFFGGIAKLNADWLRGEPLSLWLSWKTDFPLIGPLFTEEWMSMFFAYGGLLLDLFILPFLLWRRTRWFAFAFAVFFNVMNANLFTIAIFPWFMIAGSAMFFPPGWPRRLIHRLRRTEQALRRPESYRAVSLGPAGLLAFGVLALFFAIQVLLPFRHHLYPGNVNWTEEGHRFSWRMMLRYKESEIEFFATDATSSRTLGVNLLDYLTPNQVRKMATRPDMILQFSHYLKDELRDEGFDDVEIRASVETALNGRKFQALVDPAVDLTDEPYSLLPASWIVPLQEPLPPRPERLARNQRKGVSTIAASSRSLDESLSDVAKYEEALSRDSDDIVAYNNQGNAYMNLGEFDRAIENYNAVIRLDPNNIAALNNRAGAYANLGRFDLALDDLNRAIEVEPENAAFYNNRGGIYMIMEEFERAVEDYGEAISLNPNYTDAYANRARANTRLGRHDLARTDFERAVALGADPEQLFREIESDRKLN